MRNEIIEKINKKQYLSKLIRRGFVMQCIINYVVLISVVVVATMCLTFAIIGSFVNSTDSIIEEKISALSKRKPIAATTNEYSFDDYIITYFDADKVVLPQYGNMQNYVGSSFSMVNDSDLNHCKFVEVNSKTYRTITIKTSIANKDTFDGYIKLHFEFSSKFEPLTAVIITLIIFIGVSLFILLPISLFLGYVQSKPHLKAIQHSQAFTSNVSHEIATPLAIIKSNLQNMLRHPNMEQDDKSTSLAVSLNEIDRLQKLTKQLLTLSRSDDKRLILNLTPIDVAQTVTQICEPYAMIAEDQNKRFTLNVLEAANTTLLFDKDLLTQILVALLDNEIKYTRENVDINVEVDYYNDELHLVVSDTGDGVPDKELEAIFMRFFRSDKARSTHGSGLGLSIVHSIVKTMGGSVTAANVKPHGLSIALSLPVTTNNAIDNKVETYSK